MPNETITDTDSQTEAATPPQGTETPANDLSGSQTASEQQPTPPGFDEEFLKRLDGIDPTTLPQNFRQKLEAPFKADHTRKTQELSESQKKFEAERAAIFDLARKAIADRTGPAGPTAADVKRKELMDLAAAGDPVALQQAIDMAAEEKFSPVRTEMTLRNAYEEAVRTNAYVAPNMNEIINIMQTNPVIAAMANADGMKGAAKVMIALGQERELNDLRPKFQAQAKEVELLKAKLAGYEKERVVSLPSSTSRAGTTNGRPASGDALTFEEAGLRAWVESGHRAEDYR